MNWSDLIVVIIIGAIVGMEIKRGFGMALFTLVGAFLALKFALLWSTPLSAALHLSAKAGPNQALAMGVLFILLMGVVSGVTYVLHPDTFLSVDPFDNLLGAVLGFATGWLVAYAFLTGLRIWGANDVVRTSLFAPEILEFRTYHSVVDAIRGLGEQQQRKYGE